MTTAKDTSPELAHDAPWLGACSPIFHAALLRCARGETPANVAVMQLHAAAGAAAQVESVLAGALQACRTQASIADATIARLSAALVVARAHPQAFATVKAVLDGLEHDGRDGDPEAAVAHWAATFDAAVQRSAEGSVALYALGDPGLLRAATDEVVQFLRAESLLGTGRDLLEIGCGIGRFEAALAPEVRRAVGIDVSAAMIMAAKERCAGLSNVDFRHSSGKDLSLFDDASFDVVLAVDSFPYLVLSGKALVESHTREAARVLRENGRLVILNFSYGGDDARDREEVARLADASGFTVLRAGTRQFSLWDGLVFDLAKTGAR